MPKRKTIFQTLQLEWAVSCSSWPHLCLNWHPHVCAIAQRHHYGLWICYQHLGTPFMLMGLSSPDKYSKFRPFAAPRWTLTEGPRITLAPLPCVWHRVSKAFWIIESLQSTKVRAMKFWIFADWFHLELGANGSCNQSNKIFIPCWS